MFVNIIRLCILLNIFMKNKCTLEILTEEIMFGENQQKMEISQEHIKRIKDILEEINVLDNKLKAAVNEPYPPYGKGDDKIQVEIRNKMTEMRLKLEFAVREALGMPGPG